MPAALISNDGRWAKTPRLATTPPGPAKRGPLIVSPLHNHAIQPTAPLASSLPPHPVEARIGYRFRDRNLLEHALRHASITDARVKSNERLEFLGDAVLGLIACQRIFERFPHLLEGEMTKIKSAVVSRTTCAEIGKELSLEPFLSIGKGMKTHAVLPASLAAAAVEAIVAAMYLDGGLEPVRGFLLPLLESRIDRAAASGHQENYKSILQQHAQQKLSQTPEYSIVGNRGPDHSKEFQIAVKLNNETYAPAWGASKKAAEQQAALNALVSLGVLRIDDQGAVRVCIDHLTALPSANQRAPKPTSSQGACEAPDHTQNQNQNPAA